MKRTPPWHWLTTGRLLVLLPAGVLAILALGRIQDPDLWWHLKAGEWILDHRAIPRSGLWSWMGETRPWVAHEWLFEAGAAALYRLAGLRALILAKAALIALAFVLVARHARARSGSPVIACVLVLLAGIGAGPFFAERPQLATYGLTAFFLWALDGWHRGERRHLWVFPPLVAFWANLHGAYVVAFLLLGIYAASEIAAQAWRYLQGEELRWGATRHLTAVGVASLLLALANPHGVEVLTYPFRYAGAQTITRYVEEWFSPNFRDPQLQPFGLFLLLTLAVMISSPLRPALPRVLVLLSFTALALYSQRNVPLMLIAATPIAAEHLAALARRWSEARLPAKEPLREPGQFYALNWAALAALLAVVIAAVPRGARWQEFVQPQAFPARAVSYLETHPLPGRMLNHYAWGGYLIWTLPRYPVFIDGRADVYGDEIIEDYAAMRHVKPGCLKVLDKYAIDWVLWPREAPFAQLLYASPAWQPIYEDGQAVIFTRATASPPAHS